MKKDIMYVQCSLSKPTKDGEKKQVSWIPEHFAVEGKYLELKEGAEWENGWRVTSVGDVKQSQSTLNERGRDYLTTRKASDI